MNFFYRFQNCDFGEKCVPYYFCKKEVPDGLILIDEGLNSSMNCPPQERCCSDENYIRKAPAEVCDGSNGFYKMPTACGFRNVNGLGLALSEQKKNLYAQYAEFPWVVALLYEMIPEEKDSRKIVIGGGSLIHPKVVLTAAHKIAARNASKLIARAGEWELQSKKEICNHEDRRVRKVARHPSYKKGKDSGNLVLLMLYKEFQMTPFINSVCLPAADAKFDGEKCFTSGWGHVGFGEDKHFLNLLKKTELPVVPKELCETKFRATVLGTEFKLEDGVMCAGK